MKMLFSVCMTFGAIFGSSNAKAEEVVDLPPLRSESQVHFLHKKALKQGSTIPMASIQMLPSGKEISAPASALYALRHVGAHRINDVAHKRASDLLVKEEIALFKNVDNLEEIIALQAIPIQKESYGKYTVWLIGPDVTEYQNCANDVFLFGQWTHRSTCVLLLCTIGIQCIGACVLVINLLPREYTLGLSVDRFSESGFVIGCATVIGQCLLHSVALGIALGFVFVFGSVFMSFFLLGCAELTAKKVMKKFKNNSTTSSDKQQEMQLA